MNNDTPMQQLEALAKQQSAEERLQAEMVSAIPEALPDAIVVVDRAGLIRFVNSRTELMFGYAKTELIGYPVEKLIPEALASSHVAHRETFWEDPRARLMGSGRLLSARDRDGRELSVEIMLSPLIIHGQGRFVVTLIRRSAARV